MNKIVTSVPGQIREPWFKCPKYSLSQKYLNDELVKNMYVQCPLLKTTVPFFTL